MEIDNALPWFPLTPDYIDKYHDDVMKYLRDIFAASDIDLSSDKSFNTTVSLLLQRTEQIRKEYLERPLLESMSVLRSTITKDSKVIAAAALYSCQSDGEDTISYISLLCYMLSLIAPEMSGSLSSIILRCIKASELSNVGYGMDDVIEFNIPSLVKKMEGAMMVESSDVRWYQNHGTIKSTKDGLSMYALSRLFIGMKEKNSSSALRPALSIEEDRIKVMQEKKSGKQIGAGFSMERFMADCGDVREDEERVSLKTYEDGDEVSVRIKSMSYDTIYAESIDPSYETVSGEIRILGASNVRGLYMTDFARNFRMGTVINVRYEEKLGCFSINDPVVEFIYNEYWQNESYSSTTAMLLFQHSGDVPNTWLTKEGFLVRTNDNEDYPRYTQKVLDIVSYDDKYDFIIAEISDEDPDDAILNEKDVRDNFIKYLLYKNVPITSPAPKKPEVKSIDPELLTELHRVESVCSANVVIGTEQRLSVLSVSAMMACMIGDDADCDNYMFQIEYLNNLISFARNKFSSIKQLDKKGLAGERIIFMSVMNDIIAQYDNAVESDVIDQTIEQLPDTQLSAVAKLIQAANRFKGTPSLERLRVDLHREICANIGVADCIVAEEADEGRFPFRPEGEDVEHKMSWVFDNETGLFNETAQSAKCMKTICAFMNRYAEQGESHLYIGTDEKRHFICGFQPDIDELMAKGEIKAAGDVVDEYMRRIVMGKIQERFPDTYQNVTPKLLCEGKVLDLCVQPAKEGVVYFNGVSYYRSGSESKVMNSTIEDELRNRKYLLRSGMADKIDAARRAINTGHSICLTGYDSSNSNTNDKDRKVEAFAFTDEKRCDAVWAFDPKDRKNKVFLLRRADSVKVLDEAWKFEKQHQTSPLDIFGFSGSENIPFDIVLKTTRAKNQIVDMYPASAGYLEKIDGDKWRIKTTLFNKVALNAACGFYLGLSDEIDISSNGELKKIVTERIEKIVAEM